MQDRRRVVKDATDAVTAEIAHHREAEGFGVGLDGMADVAQRRARLDDGYSAHHRLVGDVDQLRRLDADFVADQEHAAGVAVPAVDDRRYVDIDDVAFLKHAIARNAVADDVVDRRADRARKLTIAERSGFGAVIAREALAE